jgi:hypothetical protein
MVGDLDQRALAVAAAYGLAQDEAIVIYSGSNVLVHLRPAPVVARVMTGTVALHDDPSRWLKREISVLEFLAPSGLAVAPSPFIAPGPHHHDGLRMTFSEWIPDVEPQPNSTTLTGSVGRCGICMMSCDRSTVTWATWMPCAKTFIASMASFGRPTARRPTRSPRFARDWTRCERSSLSRRFPPRPCTGTYRSATCSTRRNASSGMTLRTPFVGRHWDLASYTSSLRTRGASSSLVREMLNAYRWDDEQELAPFTAAQDVYVEIWQMYDRQRRRCHEPQSQAKPLSNL